MLCANLVAESSGLVDEDGDDILICSLIDEDQLLFSSDADIRAAIARLAAHKVTDTAGDFKLRQQAVGFNHTSEGLLNDPSLEDIVYPASQYCHDWMHTVFASGVFNIVVLLAFQAARKARANVWAVLRDYVLKFAWPKSVKFDPAVSDHLSPDRIKAHIKAKHFKCSASDGLNLLPVMCLFVRSVLNRVPGIDLAALDALICLADLVDALAAVSSGTISAEYLRERVRTFLAACQVAGWRPHLIPKFHWLIHLIHALERWGMLPTCWVHERKHKVAKRYGADIRNARIYGLSVLSECVSHQLVEVLDPDAFDLSVGLLQRTSAPKKVRKFLLESLELDAETEIFTSNSARLTTGSVSFKSDVVMIRSETADHFIVAQVCLFASIHDVPFALVSLWELQDFSSGLGKATWRMTERPSLIDLEDMLCSVIWRESPTGIADTLTPFLFRGLNAANL